MQQQRRDSEELRMSDDVFCFPFFKKVDKQRVVLLFCFVTDERFEMRKYQ